MSLLALLAFAGLLISIYLLYTQKTHTKPACIIGKDCKIVTESRYAKTFGIENTIFGIIYYGAFLAALLIPLPLPREVMLFATGCASIYSVYMTYLQLFVIRGICDYCMVVNALNWAVFAIVLAG